MYFPPLVAWKQMLLDECGATVGDDGSTSVTASAVAMMSIGISAPGLSPAVTIIGYVPGAAFAILIESQPVRVAPGRWSTIDVATIRSVFTPLDSWTSP